MVLFRAQDHGSIFAPILSRVKLFDWALINITILW